MDYINGEIIKLIDKVFPENAHLGRFIVGDKIIYGFDKLYSVQLSNLISIFEFDVKNFVFDFKEDEFFQQLPESLIPQLTGRFDNIIISKVISEFILRKTEFFELKSKCEQLSGEDIFTALDSLGTLLEEVYKNDAFNPELISSKIDELSSTIENADLSSRTKKAQELAIKEEMNYSQLADIFTGILLIAMIFIYDFHKIFMIFAMALALILIERGSSFIVNLFRLIKLKHYGK